MLKDRKTPVAMRWSKPCQKSTPDPFLLQYRYDASGNLVQLIYPDSQTVSYDYDARERLVSITDWNARLTTLEWDEAGRLLKVTRPNGTYREYQYDGAGRLIQIAERKASKRAICLVRFELDAAGRPTKKLPLPLPQPASVAGFSATHNADNQIAGVPYDSDGNLQSTYLPLSWFPVAEMAWDTRNRLSQIWEEVWDGEAFVGYYQSQFVYDAEGHRTHQTNGGQTTRYTVNPHGLSGLSEVLIEHEPNNTQRRYLWGGPAGLLYEIQTDSSGAETSVRYYHSDQAGSTLALTDSAGEVTGRAEYTPYGVISHTSGAMDTPYLFNGAYGVQTDFQTGLIHMRARYYHPWLGRFISEDPIQFDGGNNWYAYCGGDPLMRNDPSGLVAFALPSQYAQSAEFREGYHRGAAAAVPAGLGIGVAAFTGPVVGGAALSAGINATNQILNIHQGTQQSFSVTQMAVHGTVGAAVPVVLNRAVPAAMSFLPNSVKGTLGETFSWINGGLSGRGWSPIEQQTLRIAGRSPRPDFTYPGMGTTGATLYVEAKFGTSTLTSAQRVAANRLGENWITESWTYGWMGSTAAGAGNAVMGLGNMVLGGSGGGSSYSGGGGYDRK